MLRGEAARAGPALDGGPAAVPLGGEVPLLGREEAVVIAAGDVLAQDARAAPGRGELVDELLDLGDLLPNFLGDQELVVVDFARADLVVVSHGVIWAGVEGVPRF